MIVKIVTYPIDIDYLKTIQFESDDYIIAVDQSALTMIENNLDFDVAIGDFDSVSKKKFDLIKEKSDKIITFKIKKNHTDSYLAVKEALKKSPEEIILYGGLGKRIDHTLANLDLLMLGNIQIQTKDNCIYTLEPGTYEIENHYKYISFFAIEDVTGLNLDGFDYELDNYTLNRFDPLCISNHGQGQVSFKEGTLLCIHQNEKNTI